MPKRDNETRLPLGAGTLDLEGPPLYQQIYNAVRALIEEHGDKAVGWGLPTEDQLGAHYDVSKITVRKSLQLLERDGLIARRRAKTPVIVRKTTKPVPQRAIGTVDELFRCAADMHPTLAGIERKTNTEAAEALGVAPDTELTCVITIMHNNDMRIGCSAIYLPPEIGGNLSPEDVQQSQNLVFRHIQATRREQLDFADVTLGADVADARRAEHIGCEVGDPLMTFSILLRAADERPVEYIQSYCRADMYSLTFCIGREEPRS